MGNREFVTQYRNLRYFAASDAMIAVGAGAEAYELCHILFGKDGSIYVQFRFEQDTAGVVNVLKTDSSAPGPVTLSYADGGKVTNHLVKLSHHTSGRVHLGQKGKTTNEVGRYSFPLTGPEGKLFRLDAYHLNGFRPVSTLKKKRAYLPFIFSDGRLPDAVSVTAEWLRKDEIIARGYPRSRRIDAMTMVMQKSTGASFLVFLLGQPEGYPLRHHVLMLSLGRARLPDGVTEPSMLLMAGLDHPAATPLAPQHSGLLFLMYPSGEQLAGRLGTIDLPVL